MINYVDDTKLLARQIVGDLKEKVILSAQFELIHQIGDFNVYQLDDDKIRSLIMECSANFGNDIPEVSLIAIPPSLKHTMVHAHQVGQTMFVNLGKKHGFEDPDPVTQSILRGTFAARDIDSKMIAFLKNYPVKVDIVSHLGANIPHAFWNQGSFNFHVLAVTYPRIDGDKDFIKVGDYKIIK